MVPRLTEIFHTFPLVIAHRGASSSYIENTHKALSRALEVGADMIEVDLRLTLDSIPVLFHDADTQRLSGEKRVISESTFDELKKVPLGGSERILTLEEGLDLLRGRIPLNVEIKCAGGGIALAQFLREKGAGSKVIVSSFLREELEIFGKMEPYYPLSLLIRKPSLEDIDSLPPGRYLSLNVNRRYLDRSRVEKADKRGIPIFAYTVNHLDPYLKLRDMGVSGFFTNIPQEMVEWRGMS
jgi:glycerophosphoryl diester phosphodiesterase